MKQTGTMRNSLPNGVDDGFQTPATVAIAPRATARQPSSTPIGQTDPRRKEATTNSPCRFLSDVVCDCCGFFEMLFTRDMREGEERERFGGRGGKGSQGGRFFASDFSPILCEINAEGWR